MKEKLEELKVMDSEKMKKELSIAGLYYRYKKVTDDEIRQHLSKIKLVKKQHI